MVTCDKTGTDCQHGNDCLLRGACRLIPHHGLGNLIASQPYSTNQEPAAPSLEQLEKDAERYRKLRLLAEFGSSGGSLCFKVFLDWGDIPDGTSAEMLDQAIDALK